jgi:solute carrier family 25 (mitochondrial oxoglutarate transporter), member 11
LLRQAVYCSLRLGLYFNISDYLKTKNGGQNLTVWEKVVASGGSGLIASFIGNPCDLALVRMQADATLPISQRRSYKNVFDAIYRIITEEGVLSLWKGATPTLLRAASVNLSMMTPYDECKEKLAKMMGKETKFTLLLSCAIAGTMVSTVSLPFDNIKTKLQKMKPDAKGLYPYKGVIDCFAKSLAKEGVKGFWAGLPTYYCRCAPHSMITLLASDALKKVVKMF